MNGYVKTYYVWRRADGYVGCTARDAGRADHLGSDLTLLLETADWDDAHARIEMERRDDRHRTLVASWNDETYADENNVNG